MDNRGNCGCVTCFGLVFVGLSVRLCVRVSVYLDFPFSGVMMG